MKKLALFLIATVFSTISACALEPLILEPLGGSAYAPASPYEYTSGTDNVGNMEANIPQQAGSTNTNAYTYVNTNPNMIPQNNAAQGLPVVKKKSRRIRIETKQGSRTNTQWNPGGKGTRSYF